MSFPTNFQYTLHNSSTEPCNLRRAWLDIYVFLIVPLMPWLFFINRNNIGFFTVACAQLSILHDELNNSRNYTLLSSSDGIIEEEKYERIYIHNLTLPFWFSYCSTCLILKEEVEKPLLPALPYLRPYIHPATFNDNKRRFVLVAFFSFLVPSSTTSFMNMLLFLKKLKLEKNLSKKKQQKKQFFKFPVWH